MGLQEWVNQLPPAAEMKEKILDEVVQAKTNDKKRAGWDEVHRDLFLYFEDAPFCEITKCGKCHTCGRNGCCWACWLKNRHHVLCQWYEVEDIEEK